LTNVFDWRDRLATTTGPATIITSYDENNQRMRMNIGANTTHFPNQYFTKVFPSFAATAHVLLNGRTVATITGMRIPEEVARESAMMSPTIPI
jgi:hypothetical protein